MAQTAQRLHEATDAMRHARLELAASYRIAARHGLDDGIWNHFSLAVPGTTDRFLLKPHGLLFSEVTPSNLIVVDLDGNMVEGEGKWEPTAFYIHARLHAALPHGKCILHTHMRHATAITNLTQNHILPINQHALRLWGRVAYFDDYGGLALDNSEADRMVAALQDKDVLMMANHGVSVVGRTVADAVYTLHYLEVACQMQTLTLSTGQTPRLISDDVAAQTFEQFELEREEGSLLHLAAEMRMLDRTSPGWRS